MRKSCTNWFCRQEISYPDVSLVVVVTAVTVDLVINFLGGFAVFVVAGVGGAAGGLAVALALVLL